MNVGELHGGVIHGLERPAARIEGFGTGLFEDGQGVGARRFFKRVAEEELRAIRGARRFDVDEELIQFIRDKHLTNGDQSYRALPGVMAQVRAPFPTMWIEYGARGINNTAKRVVVGCLFEDFKTHFNLHWFSEFETDQHAIRYHTLALQYHRDREAAWLGQVGRGGAYIEALHGMGRSCYGLHVNDDSIAPDLREMFHRTEPMVKGVYGGQLTDSEHAVSAWFGFQTRVVCWLLQILNYPWVSYEPVMVVTGRKTKTPQIRPHDSYYRAKINLPKEQHVMREITPSHDPAHSKRLHQVRGHWRVYREPDGSFRKRVWVNQHTRGNAELGVVHKDYQLSYEDSE